MCAGICLSAGGRGIIYGLKFLKGAVHLVDRETIGRIGLTCVKLGFPWETGYREHELEETDTVRVRGSLRPEGIR